MRAWSRDNRRWTKYVFKRKRDGEIVVLDATNGEKFGPSREQIIRVIRFYRDPKFTLDVKATLWKRIGQKKYPRHVLKGLIILQYLIKHSDANFREEAKRMLVQIKMLTTLEPGKKGENRDLIFRIQEEAQKVIDLLSNDALYAKERKHVDRRKAAARKSRGTSLGYDDYYGGYGTETGTSQASHVREKVHEAPVHKTRDVFDRPTDPYMDEDEAIQEFVNTMHPIRPSPIAPHAEIQWPNQPSSTQAFQWPQAPPQQQMQMQPQPQQMQMQPQPQQMQMQPPANQGMLIDMDAPVAREPQTVGEILDFTHGFPQEPSEHGMFDEFMDVVSFDFTQKRQGPTIEYGKAIEVQ